MHLFVWTIVAARSYLVPISVPRKNMVGCAQDKCTHSHYAGWGCLAKALLHWVNDGVSNNGHGIDHHALVAGLRGIVFPWNIVVVVVARGPLAHAHVLAVAAANGAPNGRGHIMWSFMWSASTDW